MTDEQLLQIANAYEVTAGRYIIGFHYPPEHVIRDMRLEGDQVIWRGPEADSQAFYDHNDIERMRFAMQSVGLM